ncbi:unnamed protein product [Fraxinus pennsylvanica]|uniref:C2H2-type domain-containing protein n=1 Tax=Fraxinus pennsylvanica TaxID=56036 RepID=A0AAD2A7G4_9LAMI|nr:unnamed protein product [Fraxinus pennsylvanica]
MQSDFSFLQQNLHTNSSLYKPALNVSSEPVGFKNCSSSASVTSPDMLEESPRNDVQEEALSSKEIIDHSQFNEGVNNHKSNLSDSVTASFPPRLSGSLKNPHPPPPVDEEKERRYGCKYCNKKFSNKQALGGHQNAHTLERTIEKNIQEGQMANFGYLPRNKFTGSLFNRSQEFFSRAMMRMPYLAQQGTMHYRMMPRTLPGINKDYPGWLRPVPGNVTQFMECPGSSCLENRPLGHFSTPRPVPNRNFLGDSGNVQMNGLETQGVQDHSGLDLTLRL